MTDPIGAMRARVSLKRPTRVADEIGGAAILWSNEGDVWAAIAVSSAGESADYDTMLSTAAYVVTINRRDDVRGGWRAIWGERVLRVSGVRDDGGPRIELICEEERL